MAEQKNPLLDNLYLPSFEEIQPEHVESAVNKTVASSKDILQKIENSASIDWESTLGSLDKLNRKISSVWGPISHLISVKNSEPLREAFSKAQPKIIDLCLQISQSRPIYNAVQQLSGSKEYERFSKAQKRSVDLAIQNAKLSGIDLKDEKQKRYNEISKELSELATSFSNNVLDSTKEYKLEIRSHEDVEGMPKSFLEMSSNTWNASNKGSTITSTPSQGPWMVTLDGPSYLAFIQHCPSRKLREAVYKAYITRASSGDFDNNKLITRILKLRKEKANLLGFETFAELSLSKKMAKSVENVDELLEQLYKATSKAAESEHLNLSSFANSIGFQDELKQWDIPFYAERQRESLFSYTDDELRPYFPFDHVLSGLFKLVNKLFNITVQERTEGIQTWHKDVRFFDIFDSDSTQIASFYLDPYSRPEDKRGGAWMNTCIDRGYEDKILHKPVAYLICNGTPPVGETPSLMTFREVETLFHEFGHGLQHMLTKVNHSSVSGINGIEWDAVELPSQFMENWCYHKPTIMGLTSHYEKGDQLPEEIFQKLKASKTYRSAYAMLRQLHFGMVDLELHHRWDFASDVHAINQATSKKVLVTPLLDSDRLLCSFSHIFAGGYAAGYYSYKWAEVLSADAFSAFEEANLDNEESTKEMGRKFRTTVLELGGSEDPSEVFLKFRGRPQTVQALLTHSGLNQSSPTL